MQPSDTTSAHTEADDDWFNRLRPNSSTSTTTQMATQSTTPHPQSRKDETKSSTHFAFNVDDQTFSFTPIKTSFSATTTSSSIYPPFYNTAPAQSSSSVASIMDEQAPKRLFHNSSGEEEELDNKNIKNIVKESLPRSIIPADSSDEDEMELMMIGRRPKIPPLTLLAPTFLKKGGHSLLDSDQENEAENNNGDIDKDKQINSSSPTNVEAVEIKEEIDSRDAKVLDESTTLSQTPQTQPSIAMKQDNSLLHNKKEAHNEPIIAHDLSFHRIPLSFSEPIITSPSLFSSPISFLPPITKQVTIDEVSTASDTFSTVPIRTLEKINQETTSMEEITNETAFNTEEDDDDQISVVSCVSSTAVTTATSVIGGNPCPRCTKRNELAANFCCRCGFLLQPKLLEELGIAIPEELIDPKKGFIEVDRLPLVEDEMCTPLPLHSIHPSTQSSLESSNENISKFIIKKKDSVSEPNFRVFSWGPFGQTIHVPKTNHSTDHKNKLFLLTRTNGMFKTSEWRVLTEYCKNDSSFIPGQLASTNFYLDQIAFKTWVVDLLLTGVNNLDQYTTQPLSRYGTASTNSSSFTRLPSSTGLSSEIDFNELLGFLVRNRLTQFIEQCTSLGQFWDLAMVASTALQTALANNGGLKYSSPFSQVGKALAAQTDSLHPVGLALRILTNTPVDIDVARASPTTLYPLIGVLVSYERFDDILKIAIDLIESGLCSDPVFYWVQVTCMMLASLHIDHVDPNLNALLVKQISHGCPKTLSQTLAILKDFTTTNHKQETSSLLHSWRDSLTILYAHVLHRAGFNEEAMKELSKISTPLMRPISDALVKEIRRINRDNVLGTLSMTTGVTMIDTGVEVDETELLALNNQHTMPRASAIPSLSKILTYSNVSQLPPSYQSQSNPIATPVLYNQPYPATLPFVYAQPSTQSPALYNEDTKPILIQKQPESLSVENFPPKTDESPIAHPPVIVIPSQPPISGIKILSDDQEEEDEFMRSISQGSSISHASSDDGIETGLTKGKQTRPLSTSVSTPSSTSSIFGKFIKSIIAARAPPEGTQITTPDGKIAVRAHLGESKNTFRYDEKLGRWIDEAEDLDTQLKAAVIPPPPPAQMTMKSSTQQAPIEDLMSAMSLENTFQKEAPNVASTQAFSFTPSLLVPPVKPFAPPLQSPQTQRQAFIPPITTTETIQSSPPSSAYFYTPLEFTFMQQSVSSPPTNQQTERVQIQQTQPSQLPIATGPSVVVSSREDELV